MHNRASGRSFLCISAAGIYNRSSFRQAKRDALAAWYQLLSDIVGSDVVGEPACTIESAAA
jgi:hypothetical protein